jgi:hypothetical protein
MAIVFKASHISAHNTTASGSFAALNLLDESGLSYSMVQDDFLVLFWCASDNNSRSAVFDSRYTADGTYQKLMNEISQLDSGSPGNTVTIGMYRKTMGSVPDTSIPIPYVSSSNMAIVVAAYVFQGVDQAVFGDASAQVTGVNTGRPNAPAVTMPNNGDVILVACGTSCGSTQGAIYVKGADISSVTNHFRTINSNGSSKDCTAGIGLITNPGSGTYDPFAWTGNSTDSDSAWAAYTYALLATRPTISPAATNQNQAENAAFSQVYTADMPVTWSLVGGLDQAKFSIDSGGTLTMAAKDYEAPDDSNADRVYEVTIRATDSTNIGIYTDKPVTVTITNVGAPTISPATTAYTVNHNTAFSSDHTPNTATWSIISGTDAAKFSITSPAGLLSMTAKDFFNPTDSNADNVYACTIQAVAANNEGTSTKSLTVTVTRPTVFPTAAVADNTGTHTGSWVSLSNLYADDSANAIYSNCTLGLTTDTVTASGFDLSWLPDGSTILGIEVLVEVQPGASSGTGTGYYELGVKTGTPKQTVNFTRTDPITAITLGSPTDTWGLSGADLTGAGLKSSFGVTLKGYANAGGSGLQTFQVDYIAVRIYFNPSTALTSTNVATSAASVSQATLGQIHNLGWPELVINGNFNTSDVSGWGVANGATVAVVGGRLRLTTGAGGIAYTDYNVSVTIGAKYTYRISGYDVTGQCWMWLGREGGTIPFNVNDPGDYVGTIVPDTNLLTFRLHEATAVNGNYAEYDNISISQVTELATAAPAITSSVLAERHILTTQTLVLPSPAFLSATIGQKHNITASTLATPGVSITQATIGQYHTFNAVALALPVPVISQSATTSFAVLVTTNPAIPVPSITQAVIGQKHNFTVGQITVSTGPASITNASLAVVRLLTSTNLATSAPSITNATLVTIRVLTSTNVATPAATITNATIGQKHNIADVDVVTSAPAITSATIGQKHIMAVQNVTTFSPAITQVAALGIVNFVAQNIATPAALISNATITVIPTVIKIIRPEATTATGGWTDELGGTNLAGSLDEVTANDADYAQSTPDPVDDICRIRLQSLSATSIYAPAKLRYRLKRTGVGPGPTQTVRLYSGGNGTVGSGTLVGSWTHNVTTFTDYEQDVNTALVNPTLPLYVELEAA